MGRSHLNRLAYVRQVQIGFLDGLACGCRQCPAVQVYLSLVTLLDLRTARGERGLVLDLGGLVVHQDELAGFFKEAVDDSLNHRLRAVHLAYEVKRFFAHQLVFALRPRYTPAER